MVLFRKLTCFKMCILIFIFLLEPPANHPGEARLPLLGHRWSKLSHFFIQDQHFNETQMNYVKWLGTKGGRTVAVV